MLGRNAEIKMILSEKDYTQLMAKLFWQYNGDFWKKEQVIYFADNHELDFFKKEKLLLRYRWNNQGLEVVTKKRNVDKVMIEKIDKEFKAMEDHSIKFEVDQVSRDSYTISCSLRHVLPNIHQSFPFYHTPLELLSQPQLDFIKIFSETKLNTLMYLIPIKSKDFTFPVSYKEFDSLSLSSWKIPHLYDNKIHEISMKTLTYDKKSIDHFLDYIDKLGISVNGDGMFKTNRVYETYFGV